MAAKKLKSTKKPTKKITKNKMPTDTPKNRKLKSPEYKSFKISKKIKHPGAKLTGAIKLFVGSIRLIFSHKKIFIGIVTVYLVLTLIFVKGLGISSDLTELKSTLQEVFSGGAGNLYAGAALFSYLVGSSGSASSDIAGAYQTILLIIVSLAIIWALRQVHADKKIRIRDAFYKGMYPLIPFMLVLLVIGLQLLPLLIANTVYGIVITNGLAITFLEKTIWLMLYGLFALLSLYLITSSVFALYIVTLPDVSPMQALRSARQLVRYRRWTIMRKFIFLPVAVLFIGAVIIIPLIIYATPLAEWTFFALTMLALAVIHSYVYNLYRELL